MCQVSALITPSVITLKKKVSKNAEGKQGATNQQALQPSPQRDQMLLDCILFGQVLLNLLWGQMWNSTNACPGQ